MPKIIIIENQITQFKVLRKGLVANNVVSNGDIYPDVEEWKSFMSHVKIAINEDYDDIISGEYRRIAKTMIFEKIREFKPDIFIIDYLLGGTTCEKGVELAQDIVDNIVSPQFSIIFLSRELPLGDDYDRFKEKYKGKIYIDWLSKSYSQDEVLEKNYIKEVLCRELKTVLTKNNLSEKLKEYYNKTKNSQFDDYKPIIESIIDKLEKGVSLKEQQIRCLWSIIKQGKKITKDEAAILSIN